MVRFNRRARLDPGQFRSGRSGGRGVAIAGGGLGTLIVVLLVAFLGGDPSELLAPADGGGDQPAEDVFARCSTGADAAESIQCRFVAYENSIQDFWRAEFERRNSRYALATFTPFSDAVGTGCGHATSQVGPFYCPADQSVYMDLRFFHELQTQFGARGGDFAEAYVVAHEFGHHVQNLTGQMDRVRTQRGPASDAVRLELQADCLAGVWGAHATTTPDEQGQTLITEITDADIAEGINAAQTVGDDYIQERFSGAVTPETWTHGSSAQRQRWFKRGLASGDVDRCDTFSARKL